MLGNALLSRSGHVDEGGGVELVGFCRNVSKMSVGVRSRSACAVIAAYRLRLRVAAVASWLEAVFGRAVVVVVVEGRC